MCTHVTCKGRMLTEQVYVSVCVHVHVYVHVYVHVHAQKVIGFAFLCHRATFSEALSRITHAYQRYPHIYIHTYTFACTHITHNTSTHTSTHTHTNTTTHNHTQVSQQHQHLHELMAGLQGAIRMLLMLALATPHSNSVLSGK